MIDRLEDETPSWESVELVDEYWDGPLRGVVQYRGHLHAFDREFSDEQDNFTDFYRLRAVDPEVLLWATEREAIFQRFLAVHDRGEIGREGWGALPNEKTRFNELKERLAASIRVGPDEGIALFGDFRRVGWTHDAFVVRWFDGSSSRLAFPPIVGERLNTPSYHLRHATFAISSLLAATRSLFDASVIAVVDETIAACGRLNPYDFRTGAPSRQEWIDFHTRNDEAGWIVHAAVDRFAQGGEVADLVTSIRSALELLNRRPDGWLGRSDHPTPTIITG